jgi:YHS domain-containing protein
MSDEVVSTAEVETNDEICIDAVCGMTVDVEVARLRDLISEFAEREYAFCGRACHDRFIADPVAFAVAGRSEP